MPMHETLHDDPVIEDQGMICCLCKTTWCRVTPMRGLADADCPACGAIYCDVGRVGEQ